MRVVIWVRSRLTRFITAVLCQTTERLTASISVTLSSSSFARTTVSLLYTDPSITDATNINTPVDRLPDRRGLRKITYSLLTKQFSLCNETALQPACLATPSAANNKHCNHTLSQNRETPYFISSDRI